MRREQTHDLPRDVTAQKCFAPFAASSTSAKGEPCETNRGALHGADGFAELFFAGMALASCMGAWPWPVGGWNDHLPRPRRDEGGEQKTP